MVGIVAPFPVAGIPELWEWVNEYPDRNFDDSAPRRDYSSFEAAIRERIASELTFGVTKDGVLSGFVGFAPQTSWLGSFHGIVFPKRAWGRETTEVAVRRVLKVLFGIGFEKIVASYFADNSKIDRFLKDLGAVEEGHLRRHTKRSGEWVDMKLVAIFARERQ